MSGQARWQKEFERALDHKSAVILCGNVRDSCLYRCGGAWRLGTLKEYLAHVLGRRSLRLRFYDPVAKQVEHRPDPVDVPPERGRAQASSSDLASARSSGPVQVDSPVERDLAGIRRDLAGEDGLYLVVQYADKLAPAAASTPEDQRVVLLLEKVVENMPRGNRLVLVYLQPSQIPQELYVNCPRAAVVEIPSPDRSDLRALFGHCFALDPDARAEDSVPGAARRFLRGAEEVERAVDAADGLRMLEVEQIVRGLSGSEAPDVGAFEQGVRTYKFGEARNYWDEVTLERIDGAFHWFTDVAGVKGQNEAILKVRTIIVGARADIQRKTGGNPRMPRGKLFFAGPTGVGKTLTAKKLAVFLFGTEDALLRFDMSEYGQEFQVTRLYGAPPGYVGYETGGTLTNAVRVRPFSVILFDEIEKAHPRVFDIFLQILEDGRLTDSKGETTYFSETIIIFTANLGTRTIDSRGRRVEERLELDRLRAAGNPAGVRDHFVECVERYFSDELSRPELLNRIGRDNIVVFNFIDSQDTMRGMLRHHLEQVASGFNRSFGEGVPTLRLEMGTDAVADCLWRRHQGEIRQFGGRQVENIVNRHVRDLLARAVLEAEHRGLRAAVIRLDAEDGDVVLGME